MNVFYFQMSLGSVITYIFIVSYVSVCFVFHVMFFIPIVKHFVTPMLSKGGDINKGYLPTYFSWLFFTTRMPME